jgi:hypothetical protein
VKLTQRAGLAKPIYRSISRRIVFLFLLTVPCTGNLRAGSVPSHALSVAELTKRSDVIVLGTVSFISSDWSVNRTTIETRIDLKVEEIFKGAVDQKKISFHQLGGKVGEIASSVGEAALFREGERVVVFLSKSSRDRLQLVGFFQGKFSIERRPEGEIAVRRTPGVSKPLDELPVDKFKLQVQEAIT